MFTEPEENNNYCFSIITQVIIRVTTLFFFHFISSFSKTSRNHMVTVAILKLSASVSVLY